MTMALHVEAAHRFERLALDLAFDCGPGLTALVGPSGAGKTTVLNVIAGLLRPDRAIVRLDGMVLADTDAGVWLRPAARRIGYVFQEPRLFPHFTVRQNLTFAHPGADGPGGSAPRLDLDAIVAILNLAPLLHRKPKGLSGGEQQRVALGRALLAAPRFLLLDEPLAAVDVEHRAEILPYLDAVRDAARLPMLYVTHALAEVEKRADRILTIRDGRL